VVPEWADAVIAVEATDPGAEPAGTAPGAAAQAPTREPARPQPEYVRVPESTRGENIRRAGEDVRAGETVVRAGAPLGPAAVAVLASVGIEEVACGRRPRVAVLVTGDELVAPGASLRPGQVRDANAYSLAAQAEQAGGVVIHRRLVGDNRDKTVAALDAALEAADVVCVSGGVSVGAHDHVRAALARLGAEERFWGVALKPGKPTWFGVNGRTLVFGLPGNPVSAMVTFHLFARSALARLAGAAEPGPVRGVAVLDEAVPRNARREQAVRCRLETRPDGWHARPTGPQGSHVLTSMLRADALALVPAGAGELGAGERVEVELLAG
jgi:molybdopterin molybdotransferase